LVTDNPSGEPGQEDDTITIPAFALQREGAGVYRYLTAEIPGLRESSETPGLWYQFAFCDAGTPNGKHYLPGWLNALVLSVVLGGKSATEFRYILIGKREYSAVRYRFLGENRGEGKSLFLSGEEAGFRLSALAALYESGMRRPIPVYPEWGYQVAEKIDSEDFLRDAVKALGGVLRNTPRLASSVYLGRYFSEGIDFSAPEIREFLEKVYRPMRSE
jgi:hypothetical protein